MKIVPSIDVLFVRNSLFHNKLYISSPLQKRVHGDDQSFCFLFLTFGDEPNIAGAYRVARAPAPGLLPTRATTLQ